MEEIKQYHLHKNDYSKLQFEVYDARSYFVKHEKKASKAHRHSYYQLIWFKQEGRHFIDYEVIEHRANTIFFINKNQVHYFCPDAINEGFLYHFNDLFISQFQKELLERYSVQLFNEIGDPFVVLEEPDKGQFQNITELILKELESKGYLYRDRIYHFFQTILLQVERLKQKKGSFSPILSEGFLLAVSFKKLVNKNLQLFLNIDEYATLLNTNTKSLTQHCKKYLSDTPANIIKQNKILEAKRMLANQNISIKEVGYAIGFDQPTYFTKYFKKETGLTPKAFQKTIL